ncbi:hypothetical protein ARMGADRAFT_1031136 [Armillaria gallica]|uniref:Uncharacterized protein n=1 Tax=Armillaria gallica TaxID=47427 RepID=A0A2H3DL96_ARMGA|nr:hypothetical protein ARMGADRAFT_1031136 [Armillaria gallica]
MGYSGGTIEEGYGDDREGWRDVCGCGGTLLKGGTSANGGMSLDGRMSVEIRCGQTKFAVQEFAGILPAEQTQRHRGLARRMSILVVGKSLTVGVLNIRKFNFAHGWMSVHSVHISHPLQMTIRQSSPMPILLKVLRQQYRVLAGAKHCDCKGKNKTKGGGNDTQIYTHQVPFNDNRTFPREIRGWKTC